MEKRRLVSGIVIGAIAGLAAVMTDRKVRKYTKEKLTKTVNQTSHIMKHPSETVNRFRHRLDKFNETFSTRASQTVNTLQKLEETLEKFTHKK